MNLLITGGKTMIKKIRSLFLAIVVVFTLSGNAFASTLDSNQTTNSVYSSNVSQNINCAVNLDKLKPYISKSSVIDKQSIKDIIDESAVIKKTRSLLTHQSLFSFSSDNGAAWFYTPEFSPNVNCYGYASKFSKFINPGDIYYEEGSPISRGEQADVDTVANYVLQDLQKVNRPSRIIDSATAPINSDEYRIALRVGNQNGTYDYHFMLQCNNSGWCTKAGSTPSVYLGRINPSTYIWNLGYIVNFYNSKTVYIAVKIK